MGEGRKEREKEGVREKKMCASVNESEKVRKEMEKELIGKIKAKEMLSRKNKQIITL